jgi:AcrR family transcriptional regulator
MRVLSRIDITLILSTVPACRRPPLPTCRTRRARARAHARAARRRRPARLRPQGAGAAAIHEIAAEAGLANGTFYNYFRSREELIEAASFQLAKRFFDEITASSAGVTDPAERVAIGARHFVLQAMRDSTWGAALLRVWASTSVLNERTAEPVLADLRAGRRRRRFTFTSERAAADLVRGTVLAGMRTVLEGRAGRGTPPTSPRSSCAASASTATRPTRS